MFEMSYRYISSSSTTASRFLFSLTARTADGNVSSQIIEDLYYGVSSEQSEAQSPEQERPPPFPAVSYLRILYDQMSWGQYERN